MAIFQYSFLGNIGQKNVFYDILERKNAFLDCKNNKLKSRKIEIFAKVQKWAFFNLKFVIFPTFFLSNIGHEDVF